MQLDRTEIEIRQRSTLELLDLSLQVLKRHGVKLLAATGLIGVPLLMVDVLLLQGFLSYEALLAADSALSPEFYTSVRYSLHLLGLAALQFPMFSLPTTLLLGSLMFFQPLRLSHLVQQLVSVALPSLIVLGGIRCGLWPMFLELVVDRSISFHVETEMLLLVVLIAVLMTRAFRPFAPEIIGLERCPLWAKQPEDITYSARSRSLHASGESFSAFLPTAVYTGLLLAMLMASYLFGQAVLSGSWSMNRWMFLCVMPMSLWLVSTFVAVVRFLTYLNARMGLEGWEIQLRLKAEASRMASEDAPPTVPQVATTVGGDSR
ncbi:MAG: hypothetical protein KF752_13620 [Pirellulaceae bacterium]|nr:hypothetical protein [Pirellulaceae bacterium]